MKNYKRISEKKQLHGLDTDSFVLSVNTKDIIKNLQNLEDLIDFSKLNEYHEIFNNKNKKVVGKFKTEIPKNIGTDDFICLRIKT